MHQSLTGHRGPIGLRFPMERLAALLPRQRSPDHRDTARAGGVRA